MEPILTWLTLYTMWLITNHLALKPIMHRVPIIHSLINMQTSLV